MSNPLTVILDGLTVAESYWRALLGILFILVASQFLLYSALKRIFADKLTAEEYYSLSLAGWLLPASLLSLLWYYLGTILSPQIGVFVIGGLILIASLILFTRNPKATSGSSKRTVLSLLLLTVLSIILRLAFVAKAILPLYFDSAQHYLLTRNILASLQSTNTVWSLASYYHLGFHFLTAFITFITSTKINDVMLILGQIILAVMPFSVFFMIKHWTQSNFAGIFAVILAAFGWYMPAHAVDWGKYPALVSLALIPLVLSVAYLSVQNKRILSAPKYWSLNAIFLMGMLISVFLHSRALIVFGMIALTWVLTSFWQKASRVPRFLVLGIFILVLILEIIFIQTRGILGPLFDPYTAKGLLVTSAVLILAIFAYPAYPAVVFSFIISIIFLVTSLFIPLGNLIPGYTNTTILDRPFVEMILYLPLALLGGFGLAGLEGYLQDKNLILSKTIGVFFILLISANAFFKYELYPSDCCDIVSQDDLTAIDWMDKNLPEEARILISSTDLNVLPTSAYQGSAGGDAGTWINPLINRTTIFMPLTTDFSQQQTLAAICQLQVNYVYVGKTGWAFNDSGMPAQPNAYKVILALPSARIYQVTGCSSP